jgi:hypothetical protein
MQFNRADVHSMIKFIVNLQLFHSWCNYSIRDAKWHENTKTKSKEKKAYKNEDKNEFKHVHHSIYLSTDQASNHWLMNWWIHWFIHSNQYIKMKIIDEINSMSLKQHEFIPQINQTNTPTNELSIIHHSTFNIHEIKTNKHKHKNLHSATFTLIIMWFDSFIHSLIAFPYGDILDDCPQGSNIHEISKWAKWRHSWSKVN